MSRYIVEGACAELDTYFQPMKLEDNRLWYGDPISIFTTYDTARNAVRRTQTDIANNDHRRLIFRIRRCEEAE